MTGQSYNFRGAKAEKLKANLKLFKKLNAEKATKEGSKP